MQNEKNYGTVASINGINVPLGLGVALSEDLRTLSAFSDLPTEKQNAILEKANTLPEGSDYRSLLSSMVK